jgi:hypothetical protein
MTESTSSPGGPLTFVQTQQLHRSLTEKVLDRAQSDPEWRQLLINDPERAMQEANFPEAQELGGAQPLGQGPQMGQGPPQAPREREVVGHGGGGGWWPGGRGGYGYGYGYGGPRCRWHWSWRWGWYRSY